MCNSSVVFPKYCDNRFQHEGPNFVKARQRKGERPATIRRTGGSAVISWVLVVDNALTSTLCRFAISTRKPNRPWLRYFRNELLKEFFGHDSIWAL